MGKQGADSGWTMVAPSEGMSKIAKDGFKGIAANMVELKNRENLSQINMGIFQYERFFYLIHINYHAVGDDVRGVSYVHGYCFNIADYYELCKNPSMIFGATSDNFDMEYRPEIKAYPVKDSLTYKEMSVAEIRNKYGLDNNEELKALILSVIVAIEEYEKPLCIKTRLPLEEHLQVYKEILFLVISFVPYHLRMKLTAFSGNGLNAKIFISNEKRGTHYFDLDSKDSQSDITRLKGYRFPLIYNNFLDKGMDMKKVLLNINNFVNETFENPLKNIGCDQIEAGFNFFYKNLINEKCVMSLLSSFVSYELTNTGKVYDYLESLLHVINSNCMWIEVNEKKKLEQYFIGKVSDSYRNEYSRYLVRDVLSKKKEEGFKLIYEYKSISKENYELIINNLKSADEQYYTDYYMEMELPKQLTNLDKIDIYVNQNKNELTNNISNRILDILCDVSCVEMKNADSNSRREKILKKSNLTLQSLPYIDSLHRREKEQLFYFCFWDTFQLEEFRVSDKIHYEKNRLYDIAEKGYEEKVCVNAKKLVKLLSFIDNPAKLENNMTVYEIIFTNKYLISNIAKKDIQEELKKNCRIHMVREINIAFDVTLSMFYLVDKKEFQIYEWVKMIFKNGQKSLFDPIKLNTAINTSSILKSDKIKNVLIENLEWELKEIKERDDIEKREMYRALRRCHDALCGKDVLSDNETLELQQFRFTFHKMAIGVFAIVACFLLNQKIFNLMVEEKKSIVKVIMLVAEMILLIAALITKIIVRQGVVWALKDAGLGSVGKCVVFCLSIVAACGVGVNVYMLREVEFVKMWICPVLVLLFLIFSVVAAIYNVVVAEE